MHDNSIVVAVVIRLLSVAFHGQRRSRLGQISLMMDCRERTQLIVRQEEIAGNAA